MEGSAGSPSTTLSRLLPAHSDHNMFQTADWTSKTQEDTRQRPESVVLTGSLVYQSPEETEQRHRETQESAEDPDQLCFIKGLTQTDSETTKLTAKPLPTNSDQLEEDHHPTEPPNMKESPSPKDPPSITKPDSPAPSLPKPDSPKPCETKPESPKLSIPKPDTPAPSIPKPDSPKPCETKLDSPKLYIPKPDSSNTSELKPDSPKPSIPNQESPAPSILKSDSPKPSIPNQDSPALSITEPDSPNPSVPKPDSSNMSELKPDSPKSSIPNQDSPALSIPKPDSPKSSIPNQDSPALSIPKPDSPKSSIPNQHSPALSITEPDSPKPSVPKPASQNPSNRKPDSQKPPKTKPDSPAPLIPIQDSPQPSKTEPNSQKTLLPKPDTPFLPKPKQDSTNPSETKPDSPKPPPSHLNTKETPPPLDLTTEQTPPPNMNTDATPPPLLPLSPVDLTNNSTPVPLSPPIIHQLICDQLHPNPPASSSGEPKLCGYLQKKAGPLRAWKERWFTYEEKKNQLFYYRTPQDVTPLGKVELCSATFTYPLNAERGTFHIRTPERTFILKAVTEDLMLYWLQQLQVRRWQHRQITAGPDLSNNNNNITDDFLPAMKSPIGLVGEGAANTLSQRIGLANMSLKHPLITIQNTVHSRKRSSQEWTQSVFRVETPSQTHLDTTDTNSTGVSGTSSPSEPKTPPLVLPLAEPKGQTTLPRTTKSRSMTVSRRDTMSSKRVSRLLQENQTLEEEVKAQKELVWILHKALEASQLEKRACAEFLAATDEQKRLELLRHRERQAVDLKARLQEAKEEAETVRRSQAESEAQVSVLQERVRLLEEKNTTRQEVIIKLSDQLTTCMGVPSRSSECDVDSPTFRQLQQKTQDLQDDMEAYQTQNRFLNSEIQQLTRLWRTSSEMEKSLMVKCAHLEAGNCQVESRYLSVLRQLQEVKALDPVQRAAVQKMTEEALKGELKSVKPNLAREYDEYGFKIIPDYEVEDMKLLAKIQALEIRSHNLLHQERGERPLMARWAQYLAGRSDDDFVPSPELKGLLRAGIPQEYRQQVWRWLVRARTRTIREHFPQRYQQLCEQSRASSQPAFRQIQLDLHRTLTTNQHFSSPSSPTLQQLRRILLAFSWQNPAIGYCQGLNRLAALALLVLQSEEDAFWCLVAVVEAIMPQDYYTKNLVASQADQRVLKDLLSEKLPRLAAHFEDHGIDVSLVSFNWFLVVFVESLPSDILLPLWDAFLYEGTKVIFRYALALFKYKEDDIMKIRDSVEIYQYLRFFTKTISDSRKLIGIAFNDMNPFPSRLLRNRRALHLERLQAEMHELEEQQRLFVTESAEHKDKELDAGVSEDDEDLT